MKLNLKQDRRVVVELDGDVTIEGYDGDEIVVRGDGYSPPPKRAEGLRAVYNPAIDNTKLGVAIERDPGSSTIRIVKASRRDASYVVRLPRQINVLYTQPTWSGGGKLIIRGISGSVEATTKTSDIELKDLTGTLAVSSTSGSLSAVLPGTTAAIAVSLTSGDLDLTLPATTKATLKLRSISGEIYTDFDLTLPKNPKGERLNHVGGQTVEGNLGGGGAIYMLNTISGDIFLRKAR